MKIRRISYSLLFMMTFFASVINANNEIVKKTFVSSYHSFTLVNNLIVVQAELSGVQGNYIFDTGASGLILNAVRIDDNNRIPCDLIGASSTIDNAYQTVIDNFRFGNITKRNFTASCLSLAHIEASMNMKIEGLIGMDIVKDAAIIIDYRVQLLTLTDPIADYSSADANIEISMIGGVPTIEAQLQSQRMTLAVDFGATSTILDMNVVHNLSLPIVEQIDLLTAEGTTSALNKVRCDNLRLGKTFQFTTDAVLCDLSHLQGKDQPIHGIVGLDLLKAGKVIINLTTNQLHIWTNNSKAVSN